MSVGLVFAASDGLLVVVDGQMSEKSAAAPNGRKILATDRRKFALAPNDASVVVVLTGQASMCGVEAWKWVETYLEEIDAGHVSGDLSTPRAVARAAWHVIDAAVHQDNINRQAKGLQASDGVSGFVAGFAATGEDRPAFSEVWVFSCDEEGGFVPSAEAGFGDHSYGRPFRALPERPSYLHPEDDKFGRLPADAIYERFAANADHLRATPLAEVRQIVQSGMCDVVREEELVLRRWGVGGTWTVIEIRPDVAPMVDRFEWGP